MFYESEHQPQEDITNIFNFFFPIFHRHIGKGTGQKNVTEKALERKPLNSWEVLTQRL